jgi:hypothetical protein
VELVTESIEDIGPGITAAISRRHSAAVASNKKTKEAAP